jgi:hypothetical protein
MKPILRQNITELIRRREGEILQYIHEGKNEFLQNHYGVNYPFDGDIICFLDNVSLTGNNKKYQKMYDKCTTE